MAEKDKKQLLLRLSPTLWEEISRWAEDDFRSVNGQIEYILTEAVKKRRKVKIEEETEKNIEKEEIVIKHLEDTYDLVGQLNYKELGNKYSNTREIFEDRQRD